jgi:hypothetical protein
MPDAMTETADGLPVPQRYWAILTIALGITMAVMDGAIANVRRAAGYRPGSARQSGLLDLDR